MPLKRDEMDDTRSRRDQWTEGRAGGENGKEMLKPALNFEIFLATVAQRTSVEQRRPKGAATQVLDNIALSNGDGHSEEQIGSNLFLIWILDRFN